jgi:hypothetical protein
MNVREAINRSVNFFGVAFLAIESSIALFEIINEHEWVDRLDDLVVVGLAIAGIVWYLRGRNRYGHSAAPMLFLGLAWLAKLTPFLITEADDANAIGPDYGAMVTMLLGLIVLAWQYFSARRQLANVEVVGATQGPAENDPLRDPGRGVVE